MTAMRIALVGNPNCGKTALFNLLTGSHQKVANYAGVTVERKEGRFTASSGREALERMAAEQYDVVLTDIRMPDLDGRALFREIERRWPGRAGRVVFVTGDTLASALREFVSDSGRPVIEKPFLPSEVRRVVAELIAEGR